MTRELPVDARISFIVRVARGTRARLTGVVERIDTGEKHRFASATEVSRIIERIVAAERDERRR